MKHFSFTGDPAITCFSCSPSTDTEGTEIQNSYLPSKKICFNTYDSQFECLTDFRVCRDLTLKLSSISGIGKFQLQGILASSEENFTEDFIEESFQSTQTLTFVRPVQIFDH